MSDPWLDAELARHFRLSAEASQERAPLNAALARIIAGDRSLASLLAHAPEQQRLPVLLLAAIHFEVLGDRSAPLAAWYPNLTTTPRSPDDPDLPDTLARFVHDHSAGILTSLAERHTQTNEVGRGALLVAGLGDASDLLHGRSICHIDVGTSAGLNLLLHRLRYRFTVDGTERVVEGADATSDAMTISADVRGALSLPKHLPPIAERCGLDLRPVDLDDGDSRRWLEACVWPDQADRFERLGRAIAAARIDPPDLVSGDAVTDLADQVERLRPRGVPLITTTWVLNYLTADQREAFVDVLDRLGGDGDLIWVFAEAPALTSGLPHATDQTDEHRTAVTRVVWRDGERSVEHVGIGHPHGYWIHAGADADES